MKHLLAWAFSLLTLVGQSQSKKFVFKLGDTYELPRRSEDLSFFGNDKDGIVNLTIKKEELTIMRFDPKSLAQTADKVIELPEATRNFSSETVADMGTDYFWLHSDWDKSDEKEALYYDQVDVVTGKITKTNVKLFETSKLAGSPMATNRFYGAKMVNKYGFNYSADKKRMLVSYRLVPEFKNDKKNYDKIGLQVFDEKLQKIWSGEFTMPYTEQIMDNSDFSIDSKGNAYLLAKVYESEKRRERDKETGMAGYHFEVLKFSADTKKMSSATITTDDYFINESSIIESTTGEMIIACTYSKKSKGNGTDGIFLAMLDQSGKVVKYKNGYYEFPLEELTKFKSDRTKKRMEKGEDYEIPYITVRNVNVEADGSVFIACEQFHIVVTQSSNSRTTTTTTHYYYEDILGAKINPAGQFEWLRKIPKKQHGTTGTGTMGFKLVSDASGYYFLFLDNKKNMELEEDEVPKFHQDPRGGQVVVVKLDPKGVMSKELLFDTREEEVMIYPTDFARFSGTQFIGRARIKRNTYKPLLITVK